MCFCFVPLEVYVVRRRKMKFYLRMLLLLMAAILSLSVFVGCDKPTEDETGGEDETDDPTSIFPDVERKNYNEDFNIYVQQANNEPKMYYLSEDDNDGSPMDEAVYRRQDRVEKYLGVDIVGVKYPDTDYNTYNKKVQTAVQNMDGTLDALITHPHGAVPNLISDNLLMDLGEFEGIDLDAEYWNINVMEDLELKGNYFLGLSDYNILNTHVIAFNKDLLAQYDSSLDKSVYDTVKDMEWTLDEMIDLAGLVYSDRTGDGKTVDDTYGITAPVFVAFAGFLTSSDIPMMKQDEQSGAYQVAINQSLYFEKAEGLITKLRELSSSNCAFFDFPSTTGFHTRSIPLSTGRALMETVNTIHLKDLLNYNLEFGVLPYPMYDRDQASTGYKSLQWGGYIGVLSYLKNPIMVAETLEMLSFYSENVRITYYEKLLGKQVANMPDDVAMFDIIWNSLSTDVGQTFLEVSDGRGVCYTVSELIDPSTTKNLASYINGKETLVNESFRKFINNID